MTKGTENTLKPEMWVNTYGDELFRYAMSKTGKQELSEDLVQETFLSALTAATNYKGASSERTWIYAILKNKISDHYKKASTRYEIGEKNLRNEDDNTFLDNFFDENAEWRPDTAPTSWTEESANFMEKKEFHDILTRCLDNLPGLWKQVVNQ